MSKSAPTPPDYPAAAQVQAQSSQNLNEAQTVANRPDINTPFGSQTWGQKSAIDPVTGQPVGKWTQNTTLTPELQAALTAQQGITAGQAGLAKSLLGQEVKQEQTPIDFNAMMGIAPTPGVSGTPTPSDIAAAPGATTTSMDPASVYNQKASDAAFGMFKNYNQPLMEQAKSQLDTQLQNQGLKKGDAAYDTAMRNLENQQNMATLQAENQSVLTGANVGAQQQARDLATQEQKFGQGLAGAQYQTGANQAKFGQELSAGQQGFGQRLAAAQYQSTAAGQQIAQEMQKRGFTLNQINAILGGNQIGLPPTPSFATAGAGQPIQALAAASEQGQANNAAFSAQQQGTAGLEAGAGSAILAAVIF